MIPDLDEGIVMKSALQLLVSAPEREIKRMQIIFKEIAAGNWSEAAFHLSNITDNENDSSEYIAWKNEALELHDVCVAASKAANRNLNL